MTTDEQDRLLLGEMPPTGGRRVDLRERLHGRGLPPDRVERMIRAAEDSGFIFRHNTEHFLSERGIERRRHLLHGPVIHCGWRAHWPRLDELLRHAEAGEYFCSGFPLEGRWISPEKRPNGDPVQSFVVLDPSDPPALRPADWIQFRAERYVKAGGRERPGPVEVVVYLSE